MKQYLQEIADQYDAATESADGTTGLVCDGHQETQPAATSCKEESVGADVLSFEELTDTAALPANGAAGPPTNFIAQLRAKHPQAKPIHDLAMNTPAVEPEQFWAMVEDIRQNGQVVPIITVDGKVLDGIIREIACFEAGVQPRYQEWKGDLQLTKLKASLDIFRRHLTVSQRAARVADLLRAEEGQLTELAKFANLRKPRTRTSTKKAMAKAAGVSPRILDDVIRIGEEAPEQLDDVRAGKKKVSKVVAELNKAGKPRRGSPNSNSGQVTEQGSEIAVSNSSEHTQQGDGAEFISEPGSQDSNDSRLKGSHTQSAAEAGWMDTPAHQLKCSMSELQQLVNRAKELIAKPKEMFDPETEETLWSDDPKANWVPKGTQEELERVGRYIQAVSKVVDELAGYVNDLRRIKRQLMAYEELLHKGMTQPLLINIKKQPASEQTEDDAEAPEPVLLKGE